MNNFNSKTLILLLSLVSPTISTSIVGRQVNTQLLSKVAKVFSVKVFDGIKEKQVLLNQIQKDTISLQDLLTENYELTDSMVKLYYPLKQDPTVLGPF